MNAYHNSFRLVVVLEHHVSGIKYFKKFFPSSDHNSKTFWEDKQIVCLCVTIFIKDTIRPTLPVLNTEVSSFHRYFV